MSSSGKVFVMWFWTSCGSKKIFLMAKFYSLQQKLQSKETEIFSPSWKNQHRPKPAPKQFWCWFRSMLVFSSWAVCMRSNQVTHWRPFTHLDLWKQVKHRWSASWTHLCEDHWSRRGLEEEEGVMDVLHVCETQNNLSTSDLYSACFTFPLNAHIHT